MIDEIKGMLRDVEELEGPYAVHEAQASCYAYLYLRQLKEEAAGKQRKAVGGGAGADKGRPETSENEIQTESVTVQMTYASIETEQIRRFTREWTYEEVEEKVRELQDSCIGASRAGANGARAKLEYALSCVKGGTTVIIGHARHRLSDLKEGRVPCTRIGVEA